MVNFEWNGQPPHKDINPENYSIKWQGFLKVPVTSEYVFKLECEDGGAVQINENVILSKNYDFFLKNKNTSNFRDRSITT